MGRGGRGGRDGRQGERKQGKRQGKGEGERGGTVTGTVRGGGGGEVSDSKSLSDLRWVARSSKNGKTFLSLSFRNF